MGAGHGHHRQYLHRHSPVHALPAQVKLVAAPLFVFVVVSTPHEQVWAFAGYALLLLVTAVVARLPLVTLARRMVVEVPFVAFAVLLPFLSRGEQVHVLDLPLSVSGLWAAWNVLAKASLGVLTSLIVAATTDVRELVSGLDRLRMPTLIVQITMFMLRYADVVTDEMRRMHLARVSRGFVSRDLRHLPVLARSLSALFIRSYERGERVHLAMLSRGYTGRMPLASTAGSLADWALALALPAAGLGVALSAWAVHGR
jgi:cobalt/nickel transport system permease protein